ncbi:MAG: pseudouridine synthase [Lysobacteraceae bacterium]
MSGRQSPPTTPGKLPARRVGIARLMSKRGLCSRSEAAKLVLAGRVLLNGRKVSDPEHPCDEHADRVQVDGEATLVAEPVYLMLNKPRGLLCTASDEHGRETVYRCFDAAQLDQRPLPWIAPVGRLDKASEGLLLFSNDPEWAARITDPASGPDKTYHVQIDRVADAALLSRLREGAIDAGERLAAKAVRLLRQGERNSWLEITLDEGRNRQIRRLLATQDVAVKRLIRVAIGELPLGQLAKGAWRALDAAEVDALGRQLRSPR